MSTVKGVTMIPATIQRFTAKPIGETVKRRTAGYARVSTDKEEQQNSYDAQVDYYTKYIQERDDWEFVSVYTDEGISATSTKKRDGFNRMVADALEGKIDLIVTKSVSRFARNTVDSLTTVRQLKEKGVEIYFEEQNIWTLDSKGELLITIMSSLAQEESRSISENTTWGQRKRFADGKVSLPYSRFLGYDRGDDGLPQVNEQEAEIVRYIYRLFLEGKTPGGIATILTTEGIPTPGGKAKWMQGTVRSILQNEKYAGNALLQKKYTVDFLTKKQKINEGEIPQYFVENSHPAIVLPEVFDMVQQEMKRRLSNPNRYSGMGFFASKIVCGDCSGYYGSKVWHSTDKYRRTIWQCNSKFKGKHKCTTPHFTEDEIKTRFVTAANMLLSSKNEIAENFKLISKTLFDTAALDAEKTELQSEMAVIAELTQRCVEENAHTKQNQEEYSRRYTALVTRFETAKSRYEEVLSLINERRIKKQTVESFVADILKRKEPLTVFDEQFWYATVDFVTVYSADDVRFTFKDGTVI